MVIDSTAASTVGTMIQPRLRLSACASARTSRSPAIAIAAGRSIAACGLDAAVSIAGLLAAVGLLSPARQNAKRIDHSRRTPRLHQIAPTKLHYGCRAVNPYRFTTGKLRPPIRAVMLC